MDYCSIDDAFPVIGPPSSAAVSMKQGHRKKKSKNSTSQNQGIAAGPPEPVSIDTDYDRMQYTKKEIPAPEDSNVESFANTQQTYNDTNTAFFGKGADDDDFAPYTGPSVKDSHLLEPDFKQIFDTKGFQKSAGISLSSRPDTSQLDNIFAATSYKPIKTTVAAEEKPQHDGDMKKQLDKLRARLDDLEKIRNNSQENTQAEITLFVMSGLAFLFVMDLASRF